MSRSGLARRRCQFPAAPAAAGTEYRFHARDGPPIATRRFDVDDNCAVVCRQVTALTGGG
jgi:hypothetical protein